MTEQQFSGPNSAQSKYWNTAAGDQWTADQETMDRFLSLVSERLFQHAAIQPGERILDIGCGTGATALEAAKATGAGGAVLGIDLSHAMLGLARSRAEAMDGMATLTLEVADAQSHAFAQGAYDLLQSRFGVMFFEDPRAAFANLLGALRPGGRLCFVCWGPLAEHPWFRISGAAAGKFLGKPDAADPRAPGPLAFADTDYVTGILSGAGFEDIRISSETCELLGAANIADAAENALKRGPAARLIGAHNPPPETIAAIRAEIETGLAPYQTAGGLRVPAGLHFVHAQKRL